MRATLVMKAKDDADRVTLNCREIIAQAVVTDPEDFMMNMNVDIEPPPEPGETAVPVPEPVKDDTAANTAAPVEIEDVPDEEEIPIEISNPSTSEAAGANVRLVKLATIVNQKYSPLP